MSVLNDPERTIARAGARGALVNMGATLRNLPAGRFVGFGAVAGKMTIRWAWLSTEGVMRQADFAVDTGEYLGDYLPQMPQPIKPSSPIPSAPAST